MDALMTYLCIMGVDAGVELEVLDDDAILTIQV